MKKKLWLLMLVIMFILLGCREFKVDRREVVEIPIATNEVILELTETPMTESEMTVHFIDVGQGLSILVSSHEQNIIYDGGGRDRSSRVVSYLERQLITDIDYLVSSHYDEDHLAGLIGCLNAFNIHNVIGADYEHDSNLYQSFMDKVAEKGLVVQHPDVGDIFEFGSVKMTILSTATEESNSNANSIVVKLENGENSIILTGDADSKAEAVIVNSGIDLQTDILSVAHHGSASSTSNVFLEKTLPRWAVISVGENNKYGHPDKDTMDKLEVMGIEVYRSDIQGNVVATSNGVEWRWDKEVCNDYSQGDIKDKGTQPQKGEVVSEGAKLYTGDDKSTVESNTDDVTSTDGRTVWKSANGEKYHAVPDCGRMNPNNATKMTEDQVESIGLGVCKKCF